MPKATDAATFEQRASAVPHPGVEVKAESLPPVSADGRVLLPDAGAFDPTFASAALSLKAPGSQSPVVATPFGYHVMMLLERTPALHTDDARLATLTRDEILARRRSEALRAQIASLRSREGARIERDADDLLRRLDTPQARP